MKGKRGNPQSEDISLLQLENEAQCERCGRGKEKVRRRRERDGQRYLFARGEGESTSGKRKGEGKVGRGVKEADSGVWVDGLCGQRQACFGWLEGVRVNLLENYPYHTQCRVRYDAIGYLAAWTPVHKTSVCQAGR